MLGGGARKEAGGGEGWIASSPQAIVITAETSPFCPIGPFGHVVYIVSGLRTGEYSACLLNSGAIPLWEPCQETGGRPLPSHSWPRHLSLLRYSLPLRASAFKTRKPAFLLFSLSHMYIPRGQGTQNLEHIKIEKCRKKQTRLT